MPTRVILAVVLLASFAVVDVTAAQGQSQGRGRGTGSSGGGTGSGGGTSASAVVVFHDSDRATFRDYFLSHKIVGEPLPPGIAKNVARGKPLPPGIAKKALPADLVLTLGPRAERDVTFAVVGDRVVAMRSGLVIDVMVGVFR